MYGYQFLQDNNPVLSNNKPFAHAENVDLTFS